MKIIGTSMRKPVSTTQALHDVAQIEVMALIPEADPTQAKTVH
jgi:hypothetical protein